MKKGKINAILALFLACMLLMEDVCAFGGAVAQAAARPKGTYNAGNAIAYARTWSGVDYGKWSSEGYNNAKYHAYTKDNGESGNVDCANFVSQCLYAGGLPMDGTWYSKTKGSLAWVNCTALRNYLVDTLGYKGYYGSQLTIDKIAPGDVIFTGLAGYGGGSHVLLVSKVANGKVYCCAHTSNNRDTAYSLSSFVYHISMGGGGGVHEKQIVHIDSPSGTQSGSSNINVSAWIACDEPIAYAFWEVEGTPLQSTMSFWEDQNVKNSYPDYKYAYRCSGAIDVSQLQANTPYTLKVWMGNSSYSTPVTTSSFSIDSKAYKNPIMHIDRPGSGASFGGTNNIEISGWMACDSEVHYAFFQAVGDGGYQNSLGFTPDGEVLSANPGYKYGYRLRGVIDISRLKSNQNYELILAGAMVNGLQGEIRSSFRTGNISSENTQHQVGIELPGNGHTYSGSNNFEIKGWVVANSPITYCLYQIAEENGPILCISSDIGVDESAPDLDANYPQYLYRKRYRGVIEIAKLKPHTTYTCQIWYGIGTSTESAHATCTFRTGDIIRQTYTISYNANGGSGAPANQTKTQGISASLSSVVPVRTGWRFLGWSANKYAVAPTYAPGAQYTEDSSITLYAVWEKALLISSDTLSSSFETQISHGGAWTWYSFISPVNARYQFKTASASSAASLAVYTWLGNQIGSAAGSSSGANCTLYCDLEAGQQYYIRAGFSSGSATGRLNMQIKRCYTIRYAANGAGNVPSSVIYKPHGEAISITSSIPTISRTVTLDPNGGSVSPSSLTRQDTFLCWDIDPDYSTLETYQAGASYTKNADITLYPRFKGVAAGTLPTPVRTDFIFDGWYCESDEEPYPVTSQTLLTSNITLRARWKNGKYIISFNANGGENAPSSITFNPGQSFTVPDQQPRRFGYTFEGWSTNAESTSGSYYPGKTVTPSSSMTLYAAWKSAGEITYGADEYRIYDCTFPERHIWYAFTPDETTSYFFRAAGEPDEKAVSVLSGKNSYLIPSRYITDASRIYAEFALTAGKTYYIQLDIVGVRGESGSLMIYKGHPVSYHMGSSTETDYCYDDQEDFRLRNGVTRAHTFQLNENYTGGSVSTISRTDSVQSWNTSSALTGTSYAPGSTQRFTRAVTLYPQWSKASFGTLPTPSRSGYTFEGWYTAQTGGTRITSSMLAADYISSAPTLYAHWSANIQEITIRFNSNGGDQTYVPMVYEAGSTISLPTPTRSGYTFDGWYTAQTGGTKITSSTIFRADATLWAHWTQNITYVTISFNSNGSGHNFPDLKISSGSSVSLPTPTRSGYTFDGWYTAQTGGTKITASTTFTANTTLWAHWTQNITYVTISFNSNGSGHNFPAMKIASGSAISLPNPSRSGYTFEGWYTAQTGGTKVTSSTTFSTDTTLWAHWTENIVYITVSFDSNGSGESFITQVIESGSTLSLPTPTRAGYTFDGWYTSQTGGVKVSASTAFSSDITLFAHWTMNIVYITVSFISYGDQPFDPQQIESGSTLSLPTPTRSGYTFDGWYTAETGGTRVTSSTLFNKDTVLWAHWTQDIVYITVSFDCNGGGQIFNPQKIPTGSIVSLPAPTRTGYKFMGWYTAQTGGTRVNDSTTFTADTTLWAHWSMDIVFVLISFDGNGNNQTFTSLTVESGASVPLPAPTRSGYTFDGWYTERTGGVKVTEETTFHQDTTLYAHWIFGTWESAPALDLPVLEEDCVILTWYSAVPAQAYSVYELGEDNTLLFKAKVTACRAEIRNILPGAHTYIVMPTQQNANGVWQYGKPSNQVTIQYAGNQPLTLPAALSRLEASAFEGNNAIYEVKFTGNRVTAIGDYAFRNCKNLLKITIPDSVTSFGRGIFDGCGKLVVYCSEGSAAQAYCESNQLAYKLLPN